MASKATILKILLALTSYRTISNISALGFSVSRYPSCKLQIQIEQTKGASSISIHRKQSRLYSSDNDEYAASDDSDIDWAQQARLPNPLLNELMSTSNTNVNSDLGVIMPEEGLGSPCVIKVCIRAFLL